MTDWERAKTLLAGETTCVLVKGDSTLVSTKRGIAPMIDWLGQGQTLAGFAVADRIVGKAAAMLFVKAGLSAVYAEVLSEPGKAYLERRGIPVTYGVLTPAIINRAGDGPCPMEAAVADIDDPEEGCLTLSAKLAALRGKKSS